MIDKEHLENLIAMGEALEREFKSDKNRLSDKDIYEEVVAMANTKGGVLLIGVENDGAITGSQARHGEVTDPIKLQGAIFNNTVPSINTRNSIVELEDKSIIVIEVDLYPEPCSTASGKSLRRTIRTDGKPQSVPFYPRDHISRRIDLGLLDYSAQPVEQVTYDMLDPLEFARLRQSIENRRGDRSLLELSNEELAKALRLVETHGEKVVPTIAGLLLLGKKDIIERFLPTHEVFFQVVDGFGDIKVNEHFRTPLLKVIEDIELRFSARNEEKEILAGFIRLPMPDYSPEGFREAVNNALLHRDYTRLGAIYIQMSDDEVNIINPGGFPFGITVNNILSHEPKPRNPRIAEAFKRIGLIEQTGRGVDRIYEGQLRYGRPIPDYTQTDDENVRVILGGGEGSLKFTAFVYDQDKAGKRLTIDELIVLNHLYFNRRADSTTISVLLQKSLTRAQSILEKLVERGLISPMGEKRGRVYMLHASVYKKLGDPSGYVRSRGFEPIQQEQMILQYIDVHGKIRRSETTELCNINKDQAFRLLSRMKENDIIEGVGKSKKTTYYQRKKK